MPIIRDNVVTAVFQTVRLDGAPFSAKQIALVESFADQAVIAIENARLFNELERSNREVNEALEQQTAVASVLQTISRSAFDLDSVLNELAEQATTLVGADITAVSQMVDGQFAYRWFFPSDTPEAEVMSRMRANLGGSGVMAAVLSQKTSVYSVIEPGDPYLERAPQVDREYLERFGINSFAMLALTSGNEALGNLTVIRRGDRPYTDPEKKLLQTFADQAVIAIENARLFNELEERNAEVSEALRNGSPRPRRSWQWSAPPSLPPNPFRCRSLVEWARFSRRTSRRFWFTKAMTPSCDRYSGHNGSRRCEMGRSSARWVEGGELWHTLAGGNHIRFTGSREATTRIFRVAEPVPRSGTFAPGCERVDLVTLPISVGTRFSGNLTVLRPGSRDELEPFAESDISLLETFADQAVIAIENARLFNELQEKTEELEVAGAAQVAVPGEHVARAADAAERDHRLLRSCCRKSAPTSASEDFLPDLQKIHTAGQHLLTLINGILDLSKIEAGPHDAVPRGLRYRDARARCRRHRPAAGGEERQRLAHRLPAGGIGTMHADLVKVRQVLFNLLSNAAKFTEDGTIDLTRERDRRCERDRLSPSATPASA